MPRLQLEPLRCLLALHRALTHCCIPGAAFLASPRALSMVDEWLIVTDGCFG